VSGLVVATTLHAFKVQRATEFGWYINLFAVTAAVWMLAEYLTAPYVAAGIPFEQWPNTLGPLMVLLSILAAASGLMVVRIIVLAGTWLFRFLHIDMPQFPRRIQRSLAAATGREGSTLNLIATWFRTRKDKVCIPLEYVD